MNKSLVKKIESYIPFNEQEEKDKSLMISFLEEYDNALLRENEIGHFTSSSLIVNRERTKVLMIYHNIYKSWSWAGGHLDGDIDTLYVALKEAKEETNIKNLKVLSDNIFSLEIIPVMGHIKKGKYVASHLHLNVTYLFEASESEKIEAKIDEAKDVKWIKIDDLRKEVKEEWMMDNIYAKLLLKLKDYDENK